VSEKNESAYFQFFFQGNEKEEHCLIDDGGPLICNGKLSGILTFVGGCNSTSVIIKIRYLFERKNHTEPFTDLGTLNFPMGVRF